MKLQGVNGEYQVSWSDTTAQASRAKDWCNEQFGSGWGTVDFEGNEGKPIPLWRFTFKRLYHAQWFILYWSN